MILISPSAAAAIHAHATAAFPEECCGMLLAAAPFPPISPASPASEHRPTGARDEPIHIIDAIPAQNLAPSNRASRFVLDPRGFIHADHDARSRGLSVVGCYHSHPNHAAIPSATDVSLAWPDFLYVILRVTPAGPAEMRAWRYEQGEPRELPVT